MQKNTLSRLQKAFLRSGITVSRNNHIISISRPTPHSDIPTQATVLLPPHFPLEEKAVNQLLNFAEVTTPNQHGHVCKACATPDFHPGSIAPVGSIVATTPDFVIPAAIGTDINCGMRLITTGINLNQAELHKDAIIHYLTKTLLMDGHNVPMASASFTALFAAGPAECLDLLCHQGIWQKANRSRLFDELNGCIGLNELGGKVEYAPESLMPTDRSILRDPSLGTVGSGNHFVELQVVDQIIDRYLAWQQGLKVGDVVAMIHSGSRNVGFYVGQRWMDKARAAWPQGLKHPTSGLYGLSGNLADEYLLAMGVAARYAWLNRVVLAELVRECISDIFQHDSSKLVVDIPHNVVLQENGLNIHRKGATPARQGDLALIPGSMGDFSYLVTGLGNPDWLWSCSHGAGRSIRRQAMRAIKSSDMAETPWHCVTLREERKVEESPAAYKAIGDVMDSQEQAGLIQTAVKLRPWLTFKA